MITKDELEYRQNWSLNQKIDHSLGVIDQFYQRLNGRVYISFSGGKDSTVLLWLARKIYPDIKAVFCNTGNEYPDIVKFVRDKKNKGENIDIIYPELKPKEVIEKYGFPLISKEKAQKVYYCKMKPNSNVAKIALESESRYTRLPLCYRYMIDEKYLVSSFCCDILKKHPLHEYGLKNRMSPIVGTMACESRIRELSYRKTLCNTFNERDKRKQKSRPLSIWLEKDMIDCISKNNIPISNIYNKGADRTGCMFCLFGAQFKDDNRLKLVYELHPKWYQTFMDYTNNGVTYREAARKFLQTHNIYLPDEQPLSLFT